MLSGEKQSKVHSGEKTNVKSHLVRVHHCFARGAWQTKMNLWTANAVWLSFYFQAWAFLSVFESFDIYVYRKFLFSSLSVFERFWNFWHLCLQKVFYFQAWAFLTILKVFTFMSTESHLEWASWRQCGTPGGVSLSKCHIKYRNQNIITLHT